MALRGVREARQRTSEITNGILTVKAERAMTRALNIGALNAARYTPIDTSTLINSQFKIIRRIGNEKLTGKVGYTASYAVKVHDPRFPQRFRRAGAKKEFLTKGFEDSKIEIDKAVFDEMKI